MVPVRLRPVTPKRIEYDAIHSEPEHCYEHGQRSNKESIMRKLTKGFLKPRNPLVAPVMQRKAGSHQPSNKQERQRLKRELRRSTDTMH